jgi:hypothetical protein
VKPFTPSNAHVDPMPEKPMDPSIWTAFAEAAKPLDAIKAIARFRNFILCCSIPDLIASEARIASSAIIPAGSTMHVPCHCRKPLI